MLARLDPPARQLLELAAAQARARAMPPYLVGGSVRDLLLGRATIDLDVVVVGDAVALARAIHGALGGEAAARLRLHEQFGTATILLNNGPAIDLITARSEQYPVPGALPVVTAGDLDDDLRRRDFTINALALPLAIDRESPIVDPLGGERDLARGLLRVLHDRSFLDDPTRILRGLRYAGRLDYQFEPLTDHLCRAALAAGALDTVSIQRLSHELVRILTESAAVAILDRAADYDLFAQLPAPLAWDGATRQAFLRLDALWPSVPVPTRFARWEARFALLTAPLRPKAARDLAARWHLTSGAALLAEQTAALRAIVADTELPTMNAALGRLLDPYEPAAIVTVVAHCDDATTRTTLLHYLSVVRPLVPTLDGAALIALGVPPGPIFRPALAALRDYKRDHPAVTVEDERAFLQSWVIAREETTTP